jgi:ABC-type transport system substrate-binding protein
MPIQTLHLRAVFAFLAVLVLMAGVGLAGQEKPARPAQQKQKDEEEEEKSPTKIKKPIRVGDEQTDVKRPAAPSRSSAPTAADLEQAAETASNPVVKNFYRSLAKPHDVATLRSGRTLNVRPSSEYQGPGSELKRSYTLRPYDDQWQEKPGFTEQIQGLQPYEEAALSRIDEFLKSGLDREDSSSKRYRTRLQMLQDAEKVLVAVIAFHESSWEQGLRKGDGWQPIKAKLKAKLQTVLIEQLHVLTEAKNWSAAFALATRLAEVYPNEKGVQVEVARFLAASADQSIQAQDYREARRRLLLLEAQFPNSEEMEPVRERLRSAALEKKQAAEKLAKENKIKEAAALLQEAEDIYPQLPGLHDYSLKLSNKYPILYVGVLELPENLSPATAVSDSEKQAVELLFEGLVRLSPGPAGSQMYEPVLAADMPSLQPLGREFHLLRNARWSNGKLMTAADVRQTIRLLTDKNWPGRIPEWSELMEEGVHIGGDAFHVGLTLRQGFVDPLSLMTFKVLPEGLASLHRADDPHFAKAPVGSGPFQYRGREDGQLVFVANPQYELRSGKAGQPEIREIRFFHSQDPAVDFQHSKLHLLLDLPSRRFKELNSAGLGGVTFRTLPNRRVYFLAVNHRKAQLQSESLRRALAHGVNRTEILNTCFRGPLPANIHRPLNGPFPPGSWAAKPTLPADPFNAELAKSQAGKARNERATLGKITLKYPAGDPAIEQACKLIVKEIDDLGAGIQIVPAARSAQELHQEVEVQLDFDLAYCHYDFPSEAYWLWPLFDPQGALPGGPNYMGYVGDSELIELMRKAMSHREPAVVQELMQRIHEVVYERMPFIPLWQLDTHVAIHQDLSIPAAIDPLLIFPGVEKWTLQKQ